MPYRDPDPHDPHELVGVSVPADLAAVREMARTFAEEFAAHGFDRRRLLGLFEQPFYGAPHRAWKTLGAAEIERIVDEALGFWGRFRTVVEEPAPAAPAEGGLVRIGGGSAADREA